MSIFEIKGNYVDVASRTIYPAALRISQGKIVAITPLDSPQQGYILPGFVDSHMHIESTMMTPVNFARYAISHGTLAAVADPHEIANVMGEEGIEFMLTEAQRACIKLAFTVPSCVPATSFDYSGAVLNADRVEHMMASGRFVGLSEVMNVPAVVGQEVDMQAKLASALSRGLPIDGHGPNLQGELLRAYAAAGIATDHECVTLEEALEKASLGMKILIREGSSARNYAALSPLIAQVPDRVMFCTDDVHPDDMIERGHIDKMVRWAVAEGYDLFDVIRVASFNAIDHFKLPLGKTRVGDTADFMVVHDLTDFEVLQVYLDGDLRYDCAQGLSEVPVYEGEWINSFKAQPITVDDLKLHVGMRLDTIGVEMGELITRHLVREFDQDQGDFQPDVAQDLLKIVYLNRYRPSHPQVATIQGMGLKRGAMASSIAHDSHNIIAVGCSDEELLHAINTLIAHRGAVVAVDGSCEHIIELPIAGLMSPKPCEELAKQWSDLHAVVRHMGSELPAPFMTLAFMSLMVIPSLKIGEQGLFSYDQFQFLS